MILIAPTEPANMESLLAHHGQQSLRSPVPEELGADYCFQGQVGIVAVQRKTVNDLIASVDDGRLQRETSLLRDQAAALLIVEGSISHAEIAMSHGDWDKAGIRNLMRSIQYQEGIPVERTRNLAETAEVLAELVKRFNKPAHLTLITRPRMPRSARTVNTKRDQWIHFLQGIPHVGPVLAGAIYDHFDGQPMGRSVEQYREVPGLGEKGAENVFRFIGG